MYGPYTRKDGRQHVIVYNFAKNVRQTVSYPKYLMEMKLGRLLDPDKETIDHKDLDFTNNKWTNLRVITLVKHIKEDALRCKPIDTVCVWCAKPMLIVNPSLKDMRKAGPFCSKKCSGLYGASVQAGAAKLPPKNLPKEYFRLKG